MACSMMTMLLGICYCSTVLCLQAPLTSDLDAVSEPFTRQVTTVPQYVLDYAPLCYLYSMEAYLPSDTMVHLDNTRPVINNSIPISGAPSPLTLDNINQLNNLGNASVYLASNDDFTTLPPWLDGVRPDASGKTAAVSSAIIVHDHEDDDGTVDAFFFYFYAYNQGNKLLGIDELGDHVGDWEHNMVRFQHGTPYAVWLSQHGNGGAYRYSAMEKSGIRVVNYVANGTHSNWATAGTHDHTIPDVILPDGPLIDYTDEGTLWDPLLSAYYFTVTYPNNTNGDNEYPTFVALPNPYNNDATLVNWLYFNGQWGDDQLPTDDPRQQSLLDVAFKYTAGPNGPRFKGLNRKSVCPTDGIPCILRSELSDGS